jgi:hypothetical protein
MPVTSLMPADDEQLLERLRVGDEPAFRELVKRHDRTMRRLALMFVRTPAIADEVFQAAIGACRRAGSSNCPRNGCSPRRRSNSCRARSPTCPLVTSE